MKSIEDQPREIQYLLESKGINWLEQVCKGCSGHGVQTYGSTSTWRGGLGGSALTLDVCDKCWGSGRSDVVWPSHREFYQMKKTDNKMK